MDDPRRRPVAQGRSQRCRYALQTFVALYGSWIDGLRRRAAQDRAQSIVRLLLLDVALLAVVGSCLAASFPTR